MVGACGEAKTLINEVAVAEQPLVVPVTV